MKLATEKGQIILLIISFLTLAGLAYQPDRWQRLRHRYLNLKSLAGNFIETIEPAETTGQEPIVFKGRFLFKLPHQFRVEVFEPERQIIVGKDSIIWFYFPTEKRAVLRTGCQPIPFLGFIQPLLDSTATIIEEGAGVITLADNPGDFLYQLRLELDNTGTRIDAFSFIDEMGNRCRFVLTDQRWNQQVNPKNFRFIPPKGVTVEYQ